MLTKNNIQFVKTGQHSCLHQDMYALGDIDLLNRPLVAVAGSRKIDSESSAWLRKAIADLPSNWVVVSGLALGCDRIAHESALENGLKTIAVLPSGICNITPKSNLQLAHRIAFDGLLLSAYSPKQGIRSNRQYIDRNKIIVDLSQSLIVPQFDERSGTRSTVDFAQKQNKLIITQDAGYSGNQYILSNSSYRTVIK